MPITFTPKRSEPLAGNQAHATRRRVPQHRLTRLDLVAGANQELDCHALQQEGSCHFIADVIGQLDQQRGGNHPGFGVGTGHATGVCHPVAGLEQLDTLAHRLHNTGSLDAQAARQGRRIHARAVIDVNVVEPDGGLAQPDLPRLRILGVDVLPFENIRAASFMNSNCVCHGFSVV